MKPNTGNVYSLFYAMSKNDYSHNHTHNLLDYAYIAPQTHNMDKTTQESAHQLLQDAGDWLRNYKPVQRTYIPKVHISRLYGHWRYRLRMRNNYKDYNTAQAILKYIDRTYKPKSVRTINRLIQRTCSTQ